MSSKGKNKKINIISISAIIIVMSIVMLSIGYSAFNQSLLMDDVALEVRIKSDIRITNISLDKVNNAVSAQEDYNVSNIFGDISLPSANSSITYKVQITNFGNTEMGILDITGLPNNLEYEISGYKLQDKICVEQNCKLGIKKDIYITIKYKSNGYRKEQTSYSINMVFDFRPFHKVVYENVPDNNYPKEAIDGGDFKVTLTKPFPVGAKPFVGGGEIAYRYEKDTLIVPKLTNDLVIKSGYIQSIEDLVTLSNDVKAGNSYIGRTITLERNLDFKTTDSYRNSARRDFSDINENGIDEDLLTELTTGTGFKPIGMKNLDEESSEESITSYFCGIFDGKNNKLSNLLIKKPENLSIDTNVNLGLFGYIKDSTIQNLTLTGYIEIPNKGSDVVNRSGAGAFVGAARGTSYLKNLHNYVDLYSYYGRDKLGGIVGDVSGEITNIINCDNHGNISNSNQPGGIIGYNIGSVFIDNCNNYGTITNVIGKTGASGIIATAESSSVKTIIKNSNNYGKITAENNITNEQKIGGIAGNIYNELVIENCHNEGEVVGNILNNGFTLNAGGILGRKTGGVGKIINSYNTGTVSGARRGGGIVGHINTSGIVYIDKSYNKGVVNCQYFATSDGCGGVLGHIAPGNAYILNSYNTGTINSTQVAAGIVGNFVTDGTSITILNSYNTGSINGTNGSYGIVNNNQTAALPLIIKNVYNAGNLLSGTKYGIGNILTTSRDISYAYFDNRVSAGFNVSGIGTPKILSAIKSSTFVNELNTNISKISLGSNLNEYSLKTWQLDSSDFPTLKYND